MQLITLRVEDEAVDKVLEVLSRFPEKEVEIVAKPKQYFVEDQSDQLAGMFAHYVTQKVTDEQLEKAITHGVSKRAMAGRGDKDLHLIMKVKSIEA